MFRYLGHSEKFMFTYFHTYSFRVFLHQGFANLLEFACDAGWKFSTSLIVGNAMVMMTVIDIFMVDMFTASSSSGTVQGFGNLCYTAGF